MKTEKEKYIEYLESTQTERGLRAVRFMPNAKVIHRGDEVFYAACNSAIKVMAENTDKPVDFSDPDCPFNCPRSKC